MHIIYNISYSRVRMNDPNPFVSKKSNTSRFSKDNFFSDDEIKPKEKRKNIDNSSSNINTFLVDNSKNNKPINNSQKTYEKGRNDDRKQYKEQNYNSFSSQSKQPKPQIFNIEIEEFPELVSPLTTTSTCDNLSPAKNFLEAVNTVNIIEEDNDKIKPGWIVICKSNNNENSDNNEIKIIEGELTEYRLKLKEKEDLMNKDSPNYIMEQIHEELCKIWDKNIALYDSIHGEGAYEEVYYLPPIYDDFYNYDDSDIEEEDDYDMNDIDEYSDRGWTSDYE